MPSDNDNLILTVCSDDFLYIKNEFEKMGDNIFCIVSYNLENEDNKLFIHKIIKLNNLYYKFCSNK